MEDRYDLVYSVLDLQLVDVNGERCGRAEDIEIVGEPGATAYVGWILTGSGAWHRRLPRPVRRLGAKLFGEGVLGKDLAQVPWADVEKIDRGRVELRRPADELGLRDAENELRPIIAKLPRSS
jgi:hypothetical protein